MPAVPRIDLRRRWPTILLTCILLYAGLLRMDALFKSFGPYDRPSWLAAMQPAVATVSSVLVPHDWKWSHVAEPYSGGDPHNYLRFAREMRHFYQAHVREPVFLAATRFFLILTNDADVGISLTSIAFSLLTIVATYAVGCRIATPAIGLAAAAALAIDRDCVGLAIGGWRDETFSFFAVLSMWAWLRMVQTERGAPLAGIVGAGACLTRITSITLLAPAWMWLIAERDAALRRLRLRQVGTAAGITAVLVAPYLINCAIQFGDPLYAINDHTRFYLEREGAPDAPQASAYRYVLDKFAAHPLATIDTAVGGLAVYPFSIKWSGLDAWHPGLGRLLSWLAIGGLVAWLWRPEGRLLLLVLVGSLAPYMLTWPVPGGGEWRFTLHAYPFYLLAAFWMVDRLVGVVRDVVWQRAVPALGALSRQQALATGTVLAVLILAGVGRTFGMPYLVARESLLAGEGTGIVAGPRDRWLFTDGWSNLAVAGNIRTRFSTKPLATLRIPLPGSQPYTLILRLDPLHYPGAPPQRVRVFVNQHAVGGFELTWNPERVGEYQVSLPAGMTHPGANELTIWSDTMTPIGRSGAAFPEVPRDQYVGVRLWYVRIIPTTTQTAQLARSADRSFVHEDKLVE